MNLHTTHTPAGLVVYINDDLEPHFPAELGLTEEEAQDFNRLKFYKLNGHRYAAANHPALIEGLSLQIIK